MKHHFLTSFMILAFATCTLIGCGAKEIRQVSVIDEKYVHNGTLGVPNPDIIIKIFEPNSDVEKCIDDIGEICVTGPTIFMGYINEDKETKNTLVRHHDGRTWLHTGDLGYMDKNGFIFYTSRAKRMIISNGYNIYPIEYPPKSHKAWKMIHLLLKYVF